MIAVRIRGLSEHTLRLMKTLKSHPVSYTDTRRNVTHTIFEHADHLPASHTDARQVGVRTHMLLVMASASTLAPVAQLQQSSTTVSRLDHTSSTCGFRQ